MVELLSPAGSYETLCAAVNAGADAVYIGGSMFGARAYADNPEEDLLIRGIEYCHLRSRKMYLTVNTLLKNQELERKLYSFLLPYYKNGLDGVIVQDFGVAAYIREYFPGLEIHASTQMTVTGADGAEFLKEQGVSRVVPARELSLEEIREIIDKTGIEVETFIHGAMCYSYSGQCLFSSMIGGRSGNRGRCAQPCRLPYSCSDGKKTYNGYLLSMKDMCALDLLPDILDAGIASLKIEGRMKRSEYAAGVVSIYRKYIDLYQKVGRKGYKVESADRQILMDLYNRGGFTTGYYKQHNGAGMMSMQRPNHYGTEAARIRGVKKGVIKAVALETLYQKDLLELSDGKELTLSKSVEKGSLFELPAGKASVREGQVIQRTRNEHLLEELQAKYMKESQQVKIKGDLRIFSNGSAILKMSYNDAEIEWVDVIGEPAQNVPASEDAIRKQMNKTGGSPFCFEDLKISVADGLFVPVKKVNEFRRDALKALENYILGMSRRESAEDPIEQEQKERVLSVSSGYRFRVSVLNSEQLKAVLNSSVPELDIIYLDTLMFGFGSEREESFVLACQLIDHIKNRGIRCFLNLPPVFRKKDRKIFSSEGMRRIIKQFDGFLIHTVDEFAFIRQLTQEHALDAVIAADDNFYMYNNRAVMFWKEQGIGTYTLPSELNSRELRVLPKENSELIVYGHQSLMHSAQCITANTKGCTGITQILFLKDRKSVQFPVINRCPSCCNTIYNSVPLELDGCCDEISFLAPESLRMNFTIESGEQVGDLMDYYYRVFFGKGIVSEQKISGTRGHFKRGVE